MSKPNELSQILEELALCGKYLKVCGEELLKVTNALRDYFPSEEKESLPQEESPVKEPMAEKKKYAFTDVRKAFSAKSHAGYTTEVKALITKYGADKLSAVKEEDYEALMADLEAIG